jgi:transcriptional regulator with XRE-family HTH domain
MEARKMNFNVRLKSLRQKRKLTQSELASILGLKPTAISNYESKRNEPSFEKLIALSKYFDVSCDYLLGVSDAYLPVGGEVLDKDIVEFFNLYQQLDAESSKEMREFASYLLYKQGLTDEIKGR